MSLFGQLVCLAVPEAAADQYASIKWEVDGRAPRSMRTISGLRRQRAPWKPLSSRQTVISSESAVFRQRIGPNDTDLAVPCSRIASKPGMP